MKFLIFVFLLTIVGVKCDDYQCPKPTETVSTLKRLHHDLGCNYDTTVRPVLKKDNSTVIKFNFLPQYVEFDEQTNTLSFFTYLGVSWMDYHMVWKPSDYDNIRHIQVKSHQIWTPSLTVFNQGDMSESQMGLYDADCVIKSSGEVQCITPTKYTSHCPTDYEEWPYDKHNCSIHIGAWMFEYAEMRFKMDNHSIDMGLFRNNHQWNVHVSPKPRSHGRRMKDDEGEMSIMISVYLQRHSARLAIVYILPIVVLMILTMVVLWLDSQSLERVIVACINFICHILALSDLHYYFPTQGSVTTPKILVFYEASVGLAAFGLVFTCVLRKLRSLSIPAPMWIASITALVIRNPVSSHLGIFENYKREATPLEGSDNNEESNTQKDRTWQELATVLEWICFGLVFLIYVIMIGIVLPPKEPKDLYHGYWF